MSQNRYSHEDAPGIRGLKTCNTSRRKPAPVIGEALTAIRDPKPENIHTKGGV